IGSFTVFSGIGTDYYSVNVNAGDNLHFATTTPAGGPGGFANNFYPELVLYDPNGNVVAHGTLSRDRRDQFIDWTVPSGRAGTWTIEVTPATPPAGQPVSSGEYGLLATGATGALPSMAVTSTNPPAGALLQPPTDYIVTFNHTIYAPSLTP